MPNRLAASNSPYLLQHADNPVNWWEWGDEAFAEAVRRDVPVFLSVGYSSCHWCHVMAHESFEDQATADILNAHFVSIKVDREVRPDVDAVYMTATQALTGQGGWPMSVWLDHQRRPFYAGTYFPPRAAHGRPSFPQLLESLATAWQTRRSEVLDSAADITAALRAHNDRRGAESDPASARGPTGPLVPAVDGPAAAGATDDTASHPLDATALAAAVEVVVTRAWDRDLGGFGRAPKFPQAMTIQWLLEHHVVTGDPIALEAAVSSLRAMARGGIHDHVVGGFARYSTDARWLLPHFEKMLSDNGLLLECYATAAAVTGNRELRAAAEGIAHWLLDDMQAPEGGFFSALDADTEGHEGATTVWSDAEFREVVTAAGVDPDLAAAWFGVRPEGNFHPERGAPTGDNILHTPVALEEFAAAHATPVQAWHVQADKAARALAQRRADRPQPGLDDKVNVAWNALAIRGLARAAALLGRRDWAEAALRAVDFIRSRMRTAQGELLHVHRGGTSWVPAFLDDEAGLAVALFELAPIVGRADLVAWAVELVDHAVATFGDGVGGWTTTRSDAADLPLRPRDDFDNAQPAGTSSLAQAAVRAAMVTGERRHADVARGILAAGHDAATETPTGFGELLRAAQFVATDRREVAIVGPAGHARDALAAAVLGVPRPGVVTVVGSGRPEPAVPLLVGRTAGDDTPRAWVCRQFTCQQPVTTPAAVQAQLDG